MPEEDTEGRKAGNQDTPEDFVLIKGGSFQMGSPDTEDWRSEDEIVHPVTVSDFYMGAYEVSQKEYQEMIINNPSNFKGDDLPVENLTWYEAVAYCNARSEKEGLEKAYTVEGRNVTWNRSADGYRLPTEAEWEYACRAGTETPFNTETSIILGYPNWWASIPMPIASFLEEYDLSGKTIVPFCSHGGGRFGQSLTAIAKLAPQSELAEGLAVSYSGGSSLSDDIAKWLQKNKLKK